MSATIQIKLVPGATDALVGFPYGSEVQWIAGEFEVDGYSYVEVALADADDTSIAQEQFLNTNPSVLGYSVRRHL